MELPAMGTLLFVPGSMVSVYKHCLPQRQFYNESFRLKFRMGMGPNFH